VENDRWPRARVEDWAESAHKHTILDVASTYERIADLAERRLDSERSRYH
jgi:hypothetical protein